ncbi:1-deoxy-D-xylulose-5-phosphate synthase [bacterium]|mgnify:CR=1 FL=1|jgi:1-deoxy-D-xylulose-5-phosphate synthase|nr:1-deoxy-D-xylulose-5-phosphate synthase [bacterium]MBT4251333.1 1-deoxy-D-xylulose-5-phosphate synthase [bacterium]MBT4598286.1 1-deoxy-D-xylulose-5-phosphate synthase [bacterium]MBT6754119.1 1-deoxy-D-xylulose-5-phosphate synthase [bacterium]MBT7037939.1 1-deoxy-D-xylulose-5-phosphate synthase [bacterium]
MKKKNKKRKVLDSVNFPSDIKKLPVERLENLCEDVRAFVIETVSKTGGHFGSNLGVVELTVALHRVFDTPKDLLIWDVGHQAYPHKILTGRKDKMYTIRKKGGLSPFPRRSESEYDALGVGHSSTSIGSAVGMTIANKGKLNSPKVIAVIGDAALTGGMALEALNHAGDIKADVLVVLNDNKMSISPNVGGMRKYLTRLISSEPYLKLRGKGEKVLGRVSPGVQDFMRRADSYTRGLITKGTFFEELGFKYYGPIDGHDIKTLTEVLENLKNIKGPKFLHVVTKKGKGYKFAEDDAFSLHAVKPFDPVTGKNNGPKNSNITYTKVFSQWICDKAKRESDLHAITPAMCEGSGLAKFSREFPERYHDVGIAEQHAVTFAAGLACQKKKPVVAIYSSFLQRAYDQLIHDVALQELDILFAIDRAGIVGADGATHAGTFDLSFLRPIPNLVLMAPSSENECYKMLDFGYDYKGIVAVRYPRGGGSDKYEKGKDISIELGKAKVFVKGRDVAILAFGSMVENSRRAAKEIGATLVDMRFIKPLDEKLLKELAKDHKFFITVEDNVIAGGAGSAVNEFVLNSGIGVAVKNLGLPDFFTVHGARDEILEEIGLGEVGILKSIEKFLIKNRK